MNVQPDPVVEQILGRPANDHFGILGLPIALDEHGNIAAAPTVEQVNRLAKKLMFHLHPDTRRTSHPLAADAFSRVEKAYRLLSDEAVLHRFVLTAQRRMSGSRSHFPAGSAQAKRERDSEYMNAVATLRDKEKAKERARHVVPMSSAGWVRMERPVL